MCKWLLSYSQSYIYSRIATIGFFFLYLKNNWIFKILLSFPWFIVLLFLRETVLEVYQVYYTILLIYQFSIHFSS